MLIINKIHVWAYLGMCYRFVKSDFTKEKKMKMTIFTLAMISLQAWAGFYSQTKVLDHTENCALVEDHWIGEFYQSYYKGWVCASRPSTEQVVGQLLSEARAYLEDPKNAPELLQQRMSEINEFQSSGKNKWQYQCGEHVKDFYRNGVLDYQRSFENFTCEKMNNVFTLKCLTTSLNYTYSEFGDQYEHNRRDAVEACGYISSQVQYDFLSFLQKDFIRRNAGLDKRIKLPNIYIKQAVFIKNQFALECFKEIFHARKGIGELAKSCGEISNVNALRKIKSILRQNGEISDSEILILSTDVD